ncbi:hypothetical protein J1N09_01515 [Aureitalea sp. L0-47]|uniref:hypothetical protein n=1 Tax=Aureitalea sp. L0-47 TaxID=2816962 RepID=UPI0022385629|nr:hypothetical protein [Aureitalea sp. L0-47]MCW5518498.1 hypothetical protein [Aureitalea sp. L0-47]
MTFINGKGAAHDADVLVSPPIQMPFSYPYRLNFECKAFNKRTGLTIIRNALGLRYDINEFEIVTKKAIKKRKNNRRAKFAIENRQRYNYQVGVASVEDFTKPAFEFAANNKIPLISLRWFLPPGVCDLFHQINTAYLAQFTDQQLQSFYNYIKGNDDENGRYFGHNVESHFRTIIDSLQRFQSRVLVGLLDSGDLIFLVAEEGVNAYNLIMNHQGGLIARYHFAERGNTNWVLDVNQGFLTLNFYIPESIQDIWREQNYDLAVARQLKERFFQRLFIFVSDDLRPFRIIDIDALWLEEINNRN